MLNATPNDRCASPRELTTVLLVDLLLGVGSCRSIFESGNYLWRLFGKCPLEEYRPSILRNHPVSRPRQEINEGLLSHVVHPGRGLAFNTVEDNIMEPAVGLVSLDVQRRLGVHPTKGCAAHRRKLLLIPRDDGANAPKWFIISFCLAQPSFHPREPRLTNHEKLVDDDVLDTCKLFLQRF